MVFLTLMMALGPGCHRQFYRKQADCEAHRLLDEKAAAVARPPNTTVRIAPDRRSRYFNPFDLDFQPRPTDDPASHQYLHCVDGRQGYPLWDAAGVTNTAESPDWWQFLPIGDDGVLTLNAENAARIALLHSPEYRDQVEELYLSALVVSTERFQFDTTFFGGAAGDFTLNGNEVPLGGSNPFRESFAITPFPGNPSTTGLNRTFATGGELVAGLANSITWELGGSNRQVASTLLDFSLVQPLLRGGGRDIVLENLTLSERRLLANVRSFERFRRSFFLNISVGRNLEGQVSLSLTPDIDSDLGVGGIVGTSGGFLGLLQTQLEIRNLEENIARLNETVLTLEDTLIELLTTIPDDTESIVRTRLLIAQTRSSMINSQSALVFQQASYQQAVDGFLRDLGLPPYLCVRIEDDDLDKFNLIERRLLQRRTEVSSLRSRVGSINVAILESGETEFDPVTDLPMTMIPWSDELESSLNQLLDDLEPLVRFNRELIDLDLPQVKTDVSDLAAALAERKADNESLRAMLVEEKETICNLLNITEIDEGLFDNAALETLGDELTVAIGALENRLLGYEDRIDKLRQTIDERLLEPSGRDDQKALSQLIRDQIVIASQDLLSEIADDVLTLQLIQARARTEIVVLPSLEIDPADAFEIARRNRRDYANAKASLVDAYRQIEVVANDLESALDVVVSGGIQNEGNNPFNLRGNRSTLQMGLQWDAPITRLLERNAYRTALIEYEQTKRDFYQLEDSIWELLRAEIRLLRANRLTFELGRQAVRIAAEQIQLNADIRALNDARGRGAGATSARDAISALSDLLSAQNGLLGTYVDYEILRRSLDLDLGTMELTPEGLWIDPQEIDADMLLSLPGTEVQTVGGFEEF